MILNYYIEVKNNNERSNLESILYSHKIGFYDATDLDPLTKLPTLEDIEIYFKSK
jgi:hypothetical protein